MMPRTVCALLVTSALLACSSGSDAPLAGEIGPNGFRKIDIAAPVTGELEDAGATRFGTIALQTGGGATYRAGIDPMEGPAVAAEFLPGTRALNAPIRGEARMSGQFGILQIESAQKIRGEWQGTVVEAAGNMTLSANFGTGTVSGGGDGLRVDGQIDGSRIDGVVQYDGINADLDGVIGSGSALGVFFGGGTGRGISGAFAVSAK